MIMLFDNDRLRIDYDGTTMMLDNKIFNSVRLGDYYQPSRSNFGSQIQYHKPRS